MMVERGHSARDGQRGDSIPDALLLHRHHVPLFCIYSLGHSGTYANVCAFMLMRAEMISGEVCPESEFSALDSNENLRHPGLTRRRWLSGLSAVGVAAAICDLPQPSVAYAGAARPIALPDLVRRSKHVVVATPRTADCMWEQIGGSRRIVTYTRLTIEESLDDRTLGDSEVIVRTLGGRSGELGQIVHGEAELRRDETAVVFLKLRHDAVFHITGLAQGHYPLWLDDKGVRRLSSSPHLATFIGKQADAATERLAGTTVLNARLLVQGVLSGR
jgi:hypothetical protein